MKRRLLPLIVLLCAPALTFGVALVVFSLPPAVLRVIGPPLSWLEVFGFFGQLLSLVTWPIAAVLLGLGWRVSSVRDRIFAVATLVVAAIPVWIIVDVGW